MPMEDEFITLQKEKVTIKEVIILHIKKISDLSTKELTPSFWSKRPMKMGDGVAIVETYHPDTRMAYCNAVDFLLDLMMPKADKKFKDALKIIEDEENEKFEEHKKDGKKQTDWVWTKLELRRTLFGQLILLIDRIKLFDATPTITDEDLDEMMAMNEALEEDEE